jgi:ATP-dependent Lhr-like helicase
VLPSRIEAYDPEDLEALCLGGVVAWGRLKPGVLQTEEAAEAPSATAAKNGRRSGRRWAPNRMAPMGMVLREDLPYFIEPFVASWRDLEVLSRPAREVADYLDRAGASFLSEIAQGTGLLKGQAEEALWELVAHGLVTGDGIAGLRVLLTPAVKRRSNRRLRVISGGRAPERLMPVGRWSLWRGRGLAAATVNRDEANEFLARQLLRRYGLVFPELLARESRLPGWRALAQIYRRLENRGEIRGGRFISGFIGEQFALPEAVEGLRAVRRMPPEADAVVLAASDPLNLAGIITPGPRISPYSGQALVYVGGVPVDNGPLGAVRSRLQRGPS